MKMTFKRWMQHVDAILTRRYGLGSDDIADYMWYDLYACEQSPREAVSEWEDDPVFGRDSF